MRLGHFWKIETPPWMFEVPKLKLGLFWKKIYPPPLGNFPQIFSFFFMMAPLSSYVILFNQTCCSRQYETAALCIFNIYKNKKTRMYHIYFTTIDLHSSCRYSCIYTIGSLLQFHWHNWDTFEERIWLLEFVHFILDFEANFVFIK